jgi:deferrochelatase/peroxidase EfeB
MTDSSDSPMTADGGGCPYSGMSRRRLLGLIGAGLGAGVAAGAGGLAGAEAAFAGSGGSASAAAGMPSSAEVVTFHGAHQAGIVTPAQDRLHFAAFDVQEGVTRAQLVTLLQQWTTAAAAMCTGDQVGAGGAADGPPAAPPTDTGEALGLPASLLTLTVGFGPSLFGAAGKADRFGLASKRPAQLADLPAFDGDALDPAMTGGDLCVQACSNDPQVAVHAIRNLARIGRGVVAVRYSQLGFGRTSSTSTSQATPRNLMGFKDGTDNIKAEDVATLGDHVWARAADGQAWMDGGSYLVSRRIRMLIEAWDSTPLQEQERVFGRQKGTGAPPGLQDEFDPIDFTSLGGSGTPLVDKQAHVRLANPQFNGGSKILRRGYSFVDGTDGLGRLNAGLFFLAYQRDPRTGFTRINQHLTAGRNDALNEYIQHVGSGLWAIPSGVQPGEHWGQALFA